MAETTTAPTITATMNYLGDQDDRPFYHTTHRHLSRVTYDPREVAIADARGLSPSLSVEGFMLVADPLSVLDLRDPEIRDGAYLVHLQDRIRAATGARQVISDVANIRLPDPGAFQVALRTVHADYTAASARRLLAQVWDRGVPQEQGLADTAALVAASLDAPPGEMRYSRVLAINAWRPISDPPHDLPLALCASNSIDQDDVRAADFLEEYSETARYGDELSLCRANPRHRWYQFSRMRQDELLLFVEHDFAEPDSPPVMHSAFADPGCPPGVAGRASVEVRTFAFFD
jgi:hypothetical protein